MIRIALVLLAVVLLVGTGVDDYGLKSSRWQPNTPGIIGPEAGPQEAVLRSSPALAWPESRVVRLAASDLPKRTLENDSVEIPWEGMVVLLDLTVVYVDPEFAVTQASVTSQESTWEGLVDPLLTHRIFIGRDGPVLISRSIAPDPDFWAGVGVAGCESAWRAAVDSPTGDTGFWQLNRRWQEWRFLRRGWTWKDAKDAEKNTEIAFEIWSEQGWNPWMTKSCVGRSMGTSGEY